MRLSLYLSRSLPTFILTEGENQTPSPAFAAAAPCPADGLARNPPLLTPPNSLSFLRLSSSSDKYGPGLRAPVSMRPPSRGWGKGKRPSPRRLFLPRPRCHCAPAPAAATDHWPPSATVALPKTPAAASGSGGGASSSLIYCRRRRNNKETCAAAARYFGRLQK